MPLSEEGSPPPLSIHFNLPGKWGSAAVGSHVTLFSLPCGVSGLGPGLGGGSRSPANSLFVSAVRKPRYVRRERSLAASSASTTLSAETRVSNV